MRKRAAIYTRVSTKDQEPKVQMEKLTAYCEQRGWEIVDQFIDIDHGDNADRQNYKKLIDRAMKLKYDVVLVYKFDRFARSAREQVTYLEEFRAKNIDFVSFTENIDTTTPMGKAYFTIIAAIDELFLSVNRTRIKAGIEYAQKHGTKSGKPIGRQPTGHSEIKKVITLYKDGKKYPKEIQKATGISKSSYYKIVNSYDGLMRGDKPDDIQEKHYVSAKMMKRVQGIVSAMQRTEA
jgi:DNA invertase Pin-like site-specific DNA recombinase